MGVELLQTQVHANSSPQRRTSPFVATVLSMICPGLGAAYNGQTTKAIVYFAVFVGLFQMAVLTAGMPLFVFGFIGMWFFSALDSWRTAQAIRSGLNPDMADDILVKRFSGNPKLWGGVLFVLGVAFLVQRVFNVGPIMSGLLPVMLLGLGIYLVRGHIFKPKADDSDIQWSSRQPSASFALTQSRYSEGSHDPNQYTDRTRTGSWRDVN
jgi:uncharacterized membrane protein